MSNPITKSCFIYVGPTLHGVDSNSIHLDSSILICPPVKRGDIDELVSRAKPGVIAIVDGTFHAYPAVGHAELLRAIRNGWKVWGLSSMGAIRACEMSRYGLTGFGVTFRHFEENNEFSDDEVTLVHQSEPPYTPLSEPLIHIRFFLNYLVSENYISHIESGKTIKIMKEMWYGHRTLTLLEKTLNSIISEKPEFKMLLSNFERFQIKKQDCIKFINTKAWLQEEK